MQKNLSLFFLGKDTIQDKPLVQKAIFERNINIKIVANKDGRSYHYFDSVSKQFNIQSLDQYLTQLEGKLKKDLKLIDFGIIAKSGTT